MNWQPIESAPRDVDVLLFADGEWAIAMQVECGDWLDNYSVRILGATHWMPLPAPPEPTA